MYDQIMRLLLGNRLFRHCFFNVIFWLPFIPSRNDFREWNIEIYPPNFSPKVPFFRNTLRVSLHRILMEAGIALTPALGPFDPRSWFALYRYGGDFAGTAPNLNFVSGTKTKDPRLSAIASEEIGTGICCYILREHFVLDHITDVLAAIKSGDLVYANTSSKVRPDYFCQDSMGEVVIAESKGVTGTRCNIVHRINNKGWAQVQNVHPVNHRLRKVCGRVVIGTHFCIQGVHTGSKTTTIIKDPINEENHDMDNESDTLIRFSYAKCLRFIGQDVFADRLLIRQSMQEMLDYPVLKLNGIDVRVVGITPFEDIVGFYDPVVKIFATDSMKLLTKHIFKVLRGFRGIYMKLSEYGYALPNGLVVFNHNQEMK